MPVLLVRLALPGGPIREPRGGGAKVDTGGEPAHAVSCITGTGVVSVGTIPAGRDLGIHRCSVGGHRQSKRLL